MDLIGVGYPGIHHREDIINLPVEDTTKNPRILLFHTPTNLQIRTGRDSDRHFATYWMPDTTFELNKEIKIDLQLSGHTHHGQIFPFSILTGWLFKGHDYGLSRDGDFQLYTSCGTGTWGPPIRTVGRPEIVLITLKENPIP
jgi:predicted MPP superfamily phosphohydrolase